VMEGSAQRLRPMLMTVGANVLGLMPVMWASGTGSDTMKRISAPLIGGLVSAVILTLVILPAIYGIWRGFALRGAAVALAPILTERTERPSPTPVAGTFAPAHAGEQTA
jgi:copper/silver efflux system protein